MARNNEISFRAGGNIPVCGFVKLDTAADEQILKAGDGDTPFGIAQEFMDRTPGLPGSDNTIMAVLGEYVAVKAWGEDCLLFLGAGGCTRGDFLKPDASGFGVTSSSGNVSGAIALQSGAAGAKVRVVVLPQGSKMPAPFDPTVLSGLQFWPSAGVSNYTDSGLTTPAVNDGDAIGGVIDRSGNGNNATQGVSANQFALGTAGGHRGFLSSDGKRCLIGPVLNSPAAITVAAWLYQTAAAAHDQRNIISGPASLALDGISDKIAGTVVIDGDPFQESITVSLGAPLALNTWTHVAMVYDGSAVKVYRDGVLDMHAAGVSGLISVTANPVGVSAASEGWKGMMDQPVIYSRALTDAEIARLAQFHP